jgi:hypothetical protein
MKSRVFKSKKLLEQLGEFLEKFEKTHRKVESNRGEARTLPGAPRARAQALFSGPGAASRGRGCRA